MKKTLLIFFIFFAVRAYSQTISGGISAGVNYTNLPGPGTFFFYPSGSYNPGFRVGGLMDIGFKAFSIQPGVFYSTAGGHSRDNFYDQSGNLIDYSDDKMVLDYIKIPVNLLYKIKTGSGSVFIGGGGYAAIGVSGKISYFTNQSNSFTSKLKFGSDYGAIKKHDFGINIIEGYRLNSAVAISGEYSIGLVNVYNTTASNKNRGFNISVDYFF